jgi:ATP-dependent protease ClpP protease subunit
LSDEIENTCNTCTPTVTSPPAFGAAFSHTQATTLANDHGIFTLAGVIDEAVGDMCLSFLLLALKRAQPPTLIICSPGGEEPYARAAIGAIEACKASGLVVTTIGVGDVCSAAFNIFISGSKGHRYAHELSTYMTHATSTNTRNKREGELCEETDRAIINAYTTVDSRLRNRWQETGDHFMSADEAVKHGAADHVIKSGATWPL